jgi:hypothetical protein
VQWLCTLGTDIDTVKNPSEENDMNRFLALATLLSLTACAETTTSVGSAPSAMEMAEARLASVPSIPDTAPLTGAALVERVSGGPYALTIYSDGIIGTSNWDLAAGRAFGTFRVVATGDDGEWSLPASVADDRLCTEQSAGTVCRTVYAYEDGFLEVTDAGRVHAVSMPMP